MIFSKIIGTGHYLPSRVVSNEELSRTLDTSDEWISSRTGIRQRHIAAADESSVDLAQRAAERALAAAGLQGSDLDLIIVATSTPEHIFPSDASQLQQRLGCRPIPAFDMQAACSGFIYGLVTADNFIRAGSCQRVLLVGCDVFSHILNWQDRNTAVLFGDGAGAVVLGASPTPGILSSVIYSDGQYCNLLQVPLNVGTAENQRSQRQPYVEMSGSEVFRRAVSALADLVTELLAKAELRPEQLDFLVPHQANARIITATAKHLNLPLEKVIMTVAEHANTSAASVPLALDVGIRRGQIQPGHRLLLEAFGAGFTWGGCVVQY